MMESGSFAILNESKGGWDMLFEGCITHYCEWILKIIEKLRRYKNQERQDTKILRICSEKVMSTFSSYFERDNCKLDEFNNKYMDF